MPKPNEAVLDAKSIAQHAEKKDIQKPVDQLNHNDESDKFHNNFHKRQIPPEFNQFQQQQQFDPQQYLQQQPFIPSGQSSFPDGQQFFNQFPNQAALDEEARFFLSQQTTTLNPLSFGNDPPSTTLDPVQQQLAEQQRRFQQEIADQGLREHFSSNSIHKGKGKGKDSSSTAIQPLPTYQSHNCPKITLLSEVLISTSNNNPSIQHSTVSPSPLSFGNSIQHSTPKEDLTQIGNWLFDNLAKQIQRSLAGFTNGAGASKRHQHSTPRPSARPAFHYSTPSPFQQTTKSPFDFDLSHSTQAPDQFSSTKSPTIQYQHPYYSHTTTKSPSNFDFQYTTQAPLQLPIYQTTPVYQSTSTNVIDTSSSYPNWNNIRGVNLATSTPNYGDDFESKRTTNVIDQFENFEPKRVKNVQIIPFSTELPTTNYQTSVKPLYDNNNIYQAYKQVYDIDQQTNHQPITSTPSYLQLINSRPPPDGMSVASLFRSKLNEMKENEKANRQVIPQIKILERGYSEFQQHDKFFDQLQQNNNTNYPTNYSESTTASYDNPSTAIFIKVPEEPPTSTVGFLFDKTITKNIQKKENSQHPKHKNNSNRSPQIIKSSLVYRTPPGKRATVSRSEISRSNQIDTGLLSNLILGDSSKSLKWLLGNNVPTTTSRPFVSALLNFIQKRATGDSEDA
ncbi:mucin-3B-like [Planococcus citri]|uniref:mucin-3B-like n=1 Tax=Planococcus citri TaxID=170843 RepID=UPI0031F72E68